MHAKALLIMMAVFKMIEEASCWELLLAIFTGLVSNDGTSTLDFASWMEDLFSSAANA